MIYKHERLEKKLREHGRTASAEILSMRTEGRASSAKAQWSADDDLTTSWTLCRLQLRVMPEGEPPFETTVRTRLNTFKYKGDVVPVLYDPADHDRVVVDYQTDAQVAMGRVAHGRVDPELEELERLTAREASHGRASPGGSSDSLERLEKLAELHERGVLTDAEFAVEKAKILNEG